MCSKLSRLWGDRAGVAACQPPGGCRRAWPSGRVLRDEKADGAQRRRRLLWGSRGALGGFRAGEALTEAHPSPPPRRTSTSSATRRLWSTSGALTTMQPRALSARPDSSGPDASHAGRAPRPGPRRPGQEAAAVFPQGLRERRGPSSPQPPRGPSHPTLDRPPPSLLGTFLISFQNEIPKREIPGWGEGGGGEQKGALPQNRRRAGAVNLALVLPRGAFLPHSLEGAGDGDPMQLSFERSVTIQ